ncbi:MAG: 2Fe-2S iron-sulfur cluster binding domain-containing protein [Rhizobiales bacterium]|nr:2Fe-2S iron-sulfur cluster binding domain-containing protein [Hyphomicrobiales bacterium]
MTRVVLHINGTAREVDVDPSTPLLYVLRNALGLTGAKLGCGLEQCGSCAVLVDGTARPSCVAPVVQFEGAEIVTVEGLVESNGPGAVQRAFIEEGAAQCGYCTPGLVVAVEALRRRRPVPDEAAVRAVLAGHLCRCGTHAAVLRATRRVLRERGM